MCAHVAAGDSKPERNIFLLIFFGTFSNKLAGWKAFVPIGRPPSTVCVWIAGECRELMAAKSVGNNFIDPEPNENNLINFPDKKKMEKKMKNNEQGIKGRKGANVEESFVEKRKDFGGGLMVLWRRRNLGIGRRRRGTERERNNRSAPATNGTSNYNISAVGYYYLFETAWRHWTPF